MYSCYVSNGVGGEDVPGWFPRHHKLTLNMHSVRLIKAVGICLGVVFLITMIMGVSLLSSLLVTLVPCAIGIVIGCLVYYILGGGGRPSGRIRLASGSLSGILAAALNWFVCGRAAKPQPGFGPEIAVMIGVAVVYTCVIAGVMGIMYGAGVLPKGESEGSQQ